MSNLFILDEINPTKSAKLQVLDFFVERNCCNTAYNNAVLFGNPVLRIAMAKGGIFFFVERAFFKIDQRDYIVWISLEELNS